ncbi:MAG: ABC transporter ATP-binding protein [Anaerolineales bacterium]|nr:ABC transporter ATP-binding protein [Anaerolineales bacterium]
MSDLVIETRELTKKYDGFVAVNGLNLTVKHGEVFGLLGPNGAGKTTTILMLLGLTEPTSGSVRVLSFDPSRQPLSVKAHVGYMPESVGFYDELTAYENLIYIAKLNGLPRAEANQRIGEALERVSLAGVAHKRVGTFSRGMRQRLGVVEVLIKRPQLIIMDEPTQGLDPERAREFLEMIHSLKGEGITILLSSHLLHQVQAVCDRVGLFVRGQMVLEGRVEELARQILGGAYRISLEAEGSQEAILNALKALEGTVKVSPAGGNQYEMETDHDLRPEAAQAVVSARGRLFKLDVKAQSLDDIYARYFEEVEHGVPS